MIPLHALVLVLMGRFSSRLYVAYSSWYAIGTLASMQVPFVGFQPVRTSEHMAALGASIMLVFCFLTFTPFQGYSVCCRSLLSGNLSAPTSLRSSSRGYYLLQSFLLARLASSELLALLIRAGLPLGQVDSTPCGTRAMPRSMSQFLCVNHIADQTRRYIPIIASVSEHQPTAWPSFFMDLHFLIFLFPAGVVMCFRTLRDEHIFVIIYAVVASYFAGVMVRLMLTLTPVVCVSAAVALSSLMDTYLDPTEPNV